MLCSKFLNVSIAFPNDAEPIAKALIATAVFFILDMAFSAIWDACLNAELYDLFSLPPNLTSTS